MIELLSEGIFTLEAGGVTGLIVDLRGNPGGLLLEATRACEQFLPEGRLVVSTRGRVSGLPLNLSSTRRSASTAGLSSGTGGSSIHPGNARGAKALIYRSHPTG